MNIVKNPDICRELAEKTFERAFEKPAMSMTLEEITEHCFIETKHQSKRYITWHVTFA